MTDRVDGPSRTVFISHRHADSRIADVLGEWIRDCTVGVTIYRSSDATNAPRPGERLTDELRHQLHECGVVLCLFTSHREDWSWCMWECGLATDPLKSDTRVVILQFSDEFPAPYGDLVRVDVRNFNDVLSFVKRFLTDRNFFPAIDGPLRPDLSPMDPTVHRRAQELFNVLQEVRPPEPIEEWVSWAVLILELSMDAMDTLDKAQSEQARVDQVKAMLLRECTVVDAQRTGRNIFGFANFPTRIKFSQLYERWKGQYPESTSRWLDSLARQISLAGRRLLPAAEWEIVEGAASGTSQSSIPVLCWTRRDPEKAIVQFDIYFVPVKGRDPITGGLELGYPLPHQVDGPPPLSPQPPSEYTKQWAEKDRGTST